MNVSQLPVNGRLDALLQRLDAAENSDSEEDFDYTSFVQRRALTQKRPQELAEPDDDDNDEEGTLLGLDLDGDLDEDAQLTPYNSDHEDATLVNQDEPVDTRPSTDTGSPSTEQTENTHPEKDILNEIYTASGLNPRQSPQAPSTAAAGPSKSKAAEKNDQENQRLDRLLNREVGHHTIKNVSVASFLDDLDAPDSPIENQPYRSSEPHGASTPITSSPMAKSPRAMILSSPPPMQSLKSFVGRPESKDHDSSDDDDGLEIVPETLAQKRSQPVRQMLKFAGHRGNAVEKRLLEELHRKQRDQLTGVRAARVEELRAQGIAIEDDVRQEKQSLLEAERQRAEAVRNQESDWESENGLSDLEIEIGKTNREDDIDLDLSGSDDDDQSGEDLSVWSGSGEEDEEDDDAKEENLVRKKLPNILDSDAESGDESQATAESSTPVPATRSSTITEPTQLVNPLTATLEATQYVPPVSDELRKAFLRHSPVAKSTANQQLNSGIPEDEDKFDSTDGSEVESGPKDTVTRSPIKPDLRGIGGPDMSASQEMRLVRERFLSAQEKRRLKDSESRNKKLQKSRELFDEEAEESDDEWAGLGGSDGEGDDDLDEDENVADLVDDTAPDANSTDARKLYANQQLARDEKLVNQMVHNIHGGFRRKKGKSSEYGFLSDSGEDDLEIEIAESERMRKERENKRKQRVLESNSTVQRLAERESTKAFVSCISEDLTKPAAQVTDTIVSVEESLSFLLKPSSDLESEGRVQASHSLPQVSLDLRTTSKVPSDRMPAVDDLGSHGLRRASTYAARVTAVDGSTTSNAKPVEILLSLGTNSTKAPRARSISKMVSTPAQPAKKFKVVTTTRTTAAQKLFKRNWDK